MTMDTDKETSESKQAAEASQEQREWLRVTLSSIGDAVITTDIEGGVTFLNSVAQLAQLHCSTKTLLSTSLCTVCAQPHQLPRGLCRGATASWVRESVAAA